MKRLISFLSTFIFVLSLTMTFSISAKAEETDFAKYNYTVTPTSSTNLYLTGDASVSRTLKFSFKDVFETTQVYKPEITNSIRATCVIAYTNVSFTNCVATNRNGDLKDMQGANNYAYISNSNHSCLPVTVEPAIQISACPSTILQSDHTFHIETVPGKTSGKVVITCQASTDQGGGVHINKTITFNWSYTNGNVAPTNPTSASSDYDTNHNGVVNQQGGVSDHDYNAGSHLTNPTVLTTFEFHSTPDAINVYGEIRANECRDEDWDVLTGIPSTENLYVAAGAQLFNIDYKGEFVKQTQVKRTITINVAIENCHGDNTPCTLSCPGHVVGTQSGADEHADLDPPEYGDATKSSVSWSCPVCGATGTHVYTPGTNCSFTANTDNDAHTGCTGPSDTKATSFTCPGHTKSTYDSHGNKTGETTVNCSFTPATQGSWNEGHTCSCEIKWNCETHTLSQTSSGAVCTLPGTDGTGNGMSQTTNHQRWNHVSVNYTFGTETYSTTAYTNDTTLDKGYTYGHGCTCNGYNASTNPTGNVNMLHPKIDVYGFRIVENIGAIYYLNLTQYAVTALSNINAESVNTELFDNSVKDDIAMFALSDGQIFDIENGSTRHGAYETENYAPRGFTENRINWQGNGRLRFTILPGKVGLTEYTTGAYGTNLDETDGWGRRYLWKDGSSVSVDSWDGYISTTARSDQYSTGNVIIDLHAYANSRVLIDSFGSYGDSKPWTEPWTCYQKFKCSRNKTSSTNGAQDWNDAITANSEFYTATGSRDFLNTSFNGDATSGDGTSRDQRDDRNYSTDKHALAIVNSFVYHCNGEVGTDQTSMIKNGYRYTVTVVSDSITLAHMTSRRNVWQNIVAACYPVDKGDYYIDGTRCEGPGLGPAIWSKGFTQVNSQYYNEYYHGVQSGSTNNFTSRTDITLEQLWGTGQSYSSDVHGTYNFKSIWGTEDIFLVGYAGDKTAVGTDRYPWSDHARDVYPECSNFISFMQGLGYWERPGHTSNDVSYSRTSTMGGAQQDFGTGYYDRIFTASGCIGIANKCWSHGSNVMTYEDQRNRPARRCDESYATYFLWPTEVGRFNYKAPTADVLCLYFNTQLDTPFVVYGDFEDPNPATPTLNNASTFANMQNVNISCSRTNQCGLIVNTYYQPHWYGAKNGCNIEFITTNSNEAGWPSHLNSLPTFTIGRLTDNPCSNFEQYETTLVVSNIKMKDSFKSCNNSDTLCIKNGVYPNTIDLVAKYVKVFSTINCNGSSWCVTANATAGNKYKAKYYDNYINYDGMVSTPGYNINNIYTGHNTTPGDNNSINDIIIMNPISNEYCEVISNGEDLTSIDRHVGGAVTWSASAPSAYSSTVFSTTNADYIDTTGKDDRIGVLPDGNSNKNNYAVMGNAINIWYSDYGDFFDNDFFENRSKIESDINSYSLSYGKSENNGSYYKSAITSWNDVDFQTGSLVLNGPGDGTNKLLSSHFAGLIDKDGSYIKTMLNLVKYYNIVPGYKDRAGTADDIYVYKYAEETIRPLVDMYKGYLDRMDTSTWVKSRYVRFSFPVAYINTSGTMVSVPANTDIDLSTLHGCCKSNYTYRKVKSHDAYDFDDYNLPYHCAGSHNQDTAKFVWGNYYRFMVLTNADETANGKVEFYSVAGNYDTRNSNQTGFANKQFYQPYYSVSLGPIYQSTSKFGNNPCSKNDFKLNYKNYVGFSEDFKYNTKDYSAMSECYNADTIEIVGRIGNISVMDSGDFRWSNYFKGNLETNILDSVYATDVKKWNCFVTGRNIFKQTASAAFNYHTSLGANSLADNALKSSNSNYLPVRASVNSNRSYSLQELRPGYNLYLDIETIGNYYGNNGGTDNQWCYYNSLLSGIRNSSIQGMTVIPRYYYVNKNTGDWFPIDIYYLVDNKLTTFYTTNPNRTDNEYNGQTGYGYYMNWEDEKVRYTYVGNLSTSSVESLFSQKVKDNYGYLVRNLPSETEVDYLGNQYGLMLNSYNRTFIGSPCINGTLITNGSGDVMVSQKAAQSYINQYPAAFSGNTFNYSADDFTKRFLLQSQRWYYTLGLPSTAMVVPAGCDSSPDSVRYANQLVKDLWGENGVILMTCEYYASGTVWTLKYDASQDFEDGYYLKGSTKLKENGLTNLGGGLTFGIYYKPPTGTTTFRKDSEVAIVLMDGLNTSADDFQTVGTH